MVCSLQAPACPRPVPPAAPVGLSWTLARAAANLSALSTRVSSGISN